MRSSAIGIMCMVAAAVALAALLPAAAAMAQPQPPSVVAQASDDEDAPPPRRRGVLTEEDAPDERSDEKPLPRQGASRRLDPFDADDEPKRPLQAPQPAGAGAVVCEAGCDGPRGTIVYKKK